MRARPSATRPGWVLLDLDEAALVAVIDRIAHVWSDDDGDFVKQMLGIAGQPLSYHPDAAAARDSAAGELAAALTAPGRPDTVTVHLTAEQAKELMDDLAIAMNIPGPGFSYSKPPLVFDVSNDFDPPDFEPWTFEMHHEPDGDA